MTLETVVEFSGVDSDMWSWPIGQELGATAWTLEFWYKSGDRDYQNEPDGVTSGVVFANALGTGSQEGLQVDIGGDSGTCRLVLINDIDPLLVFRWCMPSPGWTHWLVTYDFNSGTPLLNIYYNNIEQKVSNGGTFASGAPSVGNNTITFGNRDGNGSIPHGSFGGNSRFWTSVLGSTERANAYDSGRAQDFASSGVTTPEAHIQWGSGVGDTGTRFQDLTGNLHQAIRNGFWASDGLTNWDPVRHVGVWKSLTGNDTSDWVAGRTSGTGANLTVSSASSPTNAINISGTLVGGEEFADFVRLVNPEGSHRYWQYWRVRALATTDVFGVGTVPYRQASGGEGTAIVCAINLNNGISSIHTGEYTTTFGTTRTSSDVAGTVPVSGGGTTMPGTPVADDIYGIIMQVDGNTINFCVRNETQDLAPVRLQYVVDHEVSSGERDTTAQSGHPAIFKITNGDIRVEEFQHGDLTTYQPDFAFICDSIFNVDQDLPTNSITGKVNEAIEASGTPNRWAVNLGRPGDRIEDAQSNVDGGIAARIDAKMWILEVAANSLMGAGDTVAAAQTELEDLQASLISINSYERSILHPHLSPNTFTNPTPNIPATDWHVAQEAVAALSSRAFSHSDTYDDLGDPPGTNNQLAANMDDGIHFNDTGADAWATAFFTADLSNTLILGNINTPQQFILAQPGYLGAVNDRWNDYLSDQGFSSGAQPDSLKDWLGSIGFTQGSLQDRISAWRNDGFPSS